MIENSQISWNDFVLQNRPRRDVDSIAVIRDDDHRALWFQTIKKKMD